MDELPAYLRPFVLHPLPATPVRDANLDLYLPAGDGPSAAVLFVHGGPVPADRTPTPRDWPVYRGYGAAAAERGLVGAMLDHRFHDYSLIPEAGDDVAAAVKAVRAHPLVDADRIGIWFFSGAGALMGRWLSEPPTWLRCVAASYPVFPTREELEGADVPAGEALRGAGGLPILLSRAGLERSDLAGRVGEFVAVAEAVGADLEIIEVTHGQHGFDVVDHTDESRAAVEHALAWVCERLLDGISPS